jgi:hypothetical protein
MGRLGLFIISSRDEAAIVVSHVLNVVAVVHHFQDVSYP